MEDVMEELYNPKESQNFITNIPISEPNLEYSKQRWATFREENTDAIAELYAKNPNLVKVLDDRKLSHVPLVIMRKEHLDKLINMLRDIKAGQIGIEHELTAMREVSELLAMLAKDEGLLADTPPQTDHPNLTRALRVFVSTYRAVAKRSFVFTAQSKKQSLPMFSIIEKESLPLPEDD